MLSRLFVVITLSIALAGCANWQAVENSALPQAAIQYGTVKFIDNDTDKAAEVQKIAGNLKADFAESADATVENLYARAMQEIPWAKMAPEDEILLRALLVDLKEYLKQKVGDGVLDPDQRLKIEAVLGWIEQAALLASR